MGGRWITSIDEDEVSAFWLWEGDLAVMLVGQAALPLVFSYLRAWSRSRCCDVGYGRETVALSTVRSSG